MPSDFLARQRSRRLSPTTPARPVPSGYRPSETSEKTSSTVGLSLKPLIPVISITS